MVDYDAVLQAAGGFGYYQAMLVIWYVLGLFTVAGQMGYMIFGSVAPKWVNCSTGLDPPAINIFQGNNSYVFVAPTTLSPNLNFGPDPDGQCMDTNPEFWSLAMEWRLKKSELYIIKQVITAQMVGMFFGPLVAGVLSDRFGRKKIFVVCYTLLGFASFAQGLCPGVISFSILRAVVGFFVMGSCSCAFTLDTELLPNRSRMFLNIGEWPLGYIFGALMAMATRHWKYLTWALCIPVPFVLLITIFVAESPKWQLDRGLSLEAAASIAKIAKFNRVRTDGAKLKAMLIELKAENGETKKKQVPIWKLFYSRKATLCTLVLFYGIIACALVFFPLLYNMGSLSGSVALNTIYVMLLRSFLNLSMVVIDRLFVRVGRKSLLMVGLTVVSMGLVTIIIALNINSPTEYRQSIVRVAAIISVGFCSILWAMNKFLAAESFPTQVRNGGLGICGALSRIGGILGPQALLLAEYYPAAPYIIFLGALVLHMVLMLVFVPETKNKPLPDLPIGEKNKT